MSPDWIVKPDRIPAESVDVDGLLVLVPDQRALDESRDARIEFVGPPQSEIVLAVVPDIHGGNARLHRRIEGAAEVAIVVIRGRPFSLDAQPVERMVRAGGDVLLLNIGLGAGDVGQADRVPAFLGL